MKNERQAFVLHMTLFLVCVLIPMQGRGQAWLLPIYLKEKSYETKLEFSGVLKDQEDR